jgi:predicted GIY-YIG superfamily endonuclease
MPYYIYRLIGNNNQTDNHYIGSTPYPLKRLRQHNGLLSGGAKYTSSKLNKLIKSQETDYKWNYKWTMMTFLNKSNALSLEWHMKHPFLVNNLKKTKNKGILFNNINYNRRYRFDKDINIQLLQIDITVQYFLNKKFDKIASKQMFLLIDTNEQITYKPINYSIVQITEFNKSIIENNLFTYFAPLI